MLRADEIAETKTQTDGKWVAAKPIKQPLIRRFKDALKVLKGELEAVKFYRQ